MKKILTILVVVALCAGTAQAAWSGWDLIEEEYGTGTGRGSITQDKFNTHIWLTETESENYTHLTGAWLQTNVVYTDYADPVLPSDWSMEFKARVTAQSGEEMWINIGGSGPSPGAYLNITWNNDSQYIALTERSGETTVQTTNDIFSVDSWHTYTITAETSGTTDTYEVWVDDPYRLGSPAATLSGNFGHPSIEPGANNLSWKITEDTVGLQEIDLEYFKAGTGLFVPPPIDGDVNADGIVGGYDLTKIIGNWGMSGATKADGDLSGDGTVDGTDYTEVVTNWGDVLTPPPLEPPAVPEPATLLILLSGALLAIRRR